MGAADRAKRDNRAHEHTNLKKAPAGAGASWIMMVEPSAVYRVRMQPPLAFDHSYW